MPWDTLINNALVFDGRAEAPAHQDVAIQDGKVAAVGRALDATQATEVVDADGRWLMPGLWDIHTHLDLEVELDPGLTEVVRHGTTTAVVANCSIGVPFGRQNESGHDPVVSCFARVENIPKSVLARVADKITWDNPKAYLDHFRADAARRQRRADDPALDAAYRSDGPRAGDHRGPDRRGSSKRWRASSSRR